MAKEDGEDNLRELPTSMLTHGSCLYLNIERAKGGDSGWSSRCYVFAQRGHILHCLLEFFGFQISLSFT
jgi:hypothetical protein